MSLSEVFMESNVVLETDSTSDTVPIWFNEGTEQASIPWDGRGEDPVWYEAELHFSVVEASTAVESEIELSGDIDGEGFVAVSVQQGPLPEGVRWSSANAFGSQSGTVSIGEDIAFRTHLQTSNVRVGESSLRLQVIGVGDAKGAIGVDLDRSWIGCGVSPPNDIVLQAEVSYEGTHEAVLSYDLQNAEAATSTNVVLSISDESGSFAIPDSAVVLGEVVGVSTKGSLSLPIRRNGPFTLLVGVASDNPADRQFVELTGNLTQSDSGGLSRHPAVWTLALASIFLTVLGIRLAFFHGR